jgi:hypothetical protein
MSFLLFKGSLMAVIVVMTGQTHHHHHRGKVCDPSKLIITKIMKSVEVTAGKMRNVLSIPETDCGPDR